MVWSFAVRRSPLDRTWDFGTRPVCCAVYGERCTVYGVEYMYNKEHVRVYLYILSRIAYKYIDAFSHVPTLRNCKRAARRHEAAACVTRVTRVTRVTLVIATAAAL